jgi:4-amino-4-deoxy-L-arabinose transferase-like glycosyltransferase
MEFPIYNYLVFLLWKVFGAHNWCFRLLSLVVASFGLWHFNRIVRRAVNERTALAGMVLFGTSIAFIYGRKGMPDVFSVSMVIIGASMAYDYLEKGKWRYLVQFVAFTAAGLLAKIPAANEFALLFIPVFIDRSLLLKRKLWLVGAGGVAFGIMSLWYFIWIPWAEVEYTHGWYFRLSWAEAWQQIFKDRWADTKERFFPIALQSRVAFFLCVQGLVLAVVNREKKLLWLCLAYSVLFFVFIMQVGSIFSGHEYYIIPYVPIMALLAGYALDWVIKPTPAFLVILALIAAEAIYWQKPDFFVPNEERKFQELKKITDSVVPPGEKILVNGMDGNPKMMFFAHRLGWSVTTRMQDSAWLVGESTVGLAYAIIEREKWRDSLHFPMVFENTDFSIYKIKKD